jgi:hypothetical protein
MSSPIAVWTNGERRNGERQTANGRTHSSERRTAKQRDREQVRADPASWEDLEKIDALINEFFPIALTAEEDFARAAKAGGLVLELIDLHSQLLHNVARDLREFAF